MYNPSVIILNFTKKQHFPMGQVKNKINITSLIAKSTSPGRAIRHDFLCTLAMTAAFYLQYRFEFSFKLGCVVTDKPNV